MNIDLHAHVLIPEILSRQGPVDWRPAIVPHATGGYLVQSAYHTNGPIFYPLTDAGEIVAARKAAGIDFTVLSVTPDAFFYGLPAAEGVSTIQNEGLARMVAGYPEHLAGLGTLTLQDVPLAVRELEAAMTTLGLAGVEIGSNVNGEELGSDPFRPFWEAAEALGAIVLIHPSFTHSLAGDRQKAYDLRRLMGNLMETAQAGAHLIFSGVLKSFPNVKIVLAHGGGVLPYLVGRLDHGYQVRTSPRRNISEPPSRYLRQFYYDTITHYGPALQYLIDLVGTDHIVTGSDYPFDMGYERPADIVKQLPGLSRADQDMILSENARRLLGFEDGGEADLEGVPL